jgi:hypothetical protein
VSVAHAGTDCVWAYAHSSSKVWNRALGVAVRLRCVRPRVHMPDPLSIEQPGRAARTLPLCAFTRSTRMAWVANSRMRRQEGPRRRHPSSARRGPPRHTAPWRHLSPRRVFPSRSGRPAARDRQGSHAQHSRIRAMGFESICNHNPSCALRTPVNDLSYQSYLVLRGRTVVW